MLIKDWEYNKFLENILSYKLTLIHGQDRGKVNEKLLEIINRLKSLRKNTLEIINFDPEEFYKNENYFYNLVYQKSFFSEHILIRINMDLFKTEKDFFEFVKNLDINKSNYIIIESKYLPKTSKTMNLFKKIHSHALITCYQESNVKQSILKYANLYSLNLDNYSLNYLIDKFGNDTLITKNEIKKLALYSNGENINLTTILEAIGDNSLITLNELTDSIGIKEKKTKIIYLYEKTLNLGLNYIVLLRSISRHFRIILEAKANNYKNAKDIKPLIHFSRHENINQQLKVMSVDQLRECLKRTYELELTCKTNYDTHQLFIKKFITEVTNY